MRKLLWGVGALLALPAVTVAGLLGFVHTTAGERWAAARLGEMLGGSVEGLELAWPLQPKIARLSLADRDGPWAVVRGLSVDWRPAALLDRRFSARAVEAQAVDLLRRPAGGEGGAKRLPVDVDVAALNANLTLAEAVAGQPIALAIAGSAAAGKGGVGVNLDFRRTDTAGAGKAAVHYDGERLALDVRTDESLGAVFAAVGLPPLAVRLAGDGPVGEWRGSLAATTGDARCLSADLALSGGRLAATGDAMPPCLPFAEPVNFALDGTLDNQTLRLQTSAYGGAAARIDASRHAGEWLVMADVKAARVPGQDGPAMMTGVASVDPAAAVANVLQLRARAPVGQLVLAGTVAQGGHDTALHGVALLPSLAAVAPQLAGRGIATVAIQGDALAGTLRSVFAGTAAGVTTGEARIDALMGPAPQFAGSATINRAIVETVEATVTGTGARLAVDGTGTPLALAWRLEVPDFQGSAVKATGFAAGDLREPTITGVARLRGAIDASATVAMQGFDKGRVAGSLRRDTVTAEVKSDFRLGDAPAVTNLQITSGGDRLAGDLALRPDGTVAGHLDGKLRDLAPWAALAGVDMAGQAAVAVTLSGAAGRQVVEGKIEMQDLSVAGLAFTQASLRAEAKNEAVAFRLSGRGDTAVEAGGTWRPEALRLASLDLKRNGQTAKLTEPATLARTAEGYHLDRLVLDVARGRVTVAGGMAGDAVDLRVDLSKVPMQATQAFMPVEKLNGTLDGELRLAGTRAQPQATATLRARGLGVPGGRADRVDADVSASWQDHAVRLDATAKGGRGGTNARLEASFPLVLDDAGLRLPESGPLRGRLTAEGDIERITDALPISRYRFAGRTQADLRLGGTVGNPDVDGVATVKNGYYQFYQAGLIVRNIDARLTAEDSKRFRLTARGSDGGQGRAKAEGAVRVDGGLVYDVGLELERFRIADIDTGNATASGALELHGVGDRGKLTGRLDVGPAEYNLAEHLPGGKVPHMDVIEVNKPGAAQLASTRRVANEEEEDDEDEREMRASFVIDLDIKARVNRLFVRGRGLESAWSGDLVVAGTDDDPTLAGTLQADRGTYEFIGRNFQMSNSRVVFDGGTDINPSLDILAEASAHDITAQVRVTGTADEPKIDFTSQPSYPKDEILAHLLFGKQVGQLSTGQQVQLARAAASLSGAGGGLDPVGGLRKVLGLDLLDIGTGNDTSSKKDQDSGISPRVTVGKYLDENTFVKVEEGGQKGGKVAIERQIGRGLSVEAGVARSGNGTLGLSWRTDY